MENHDVALCPPPLGISLCSGIGGLDLGIAAALPGYRTVCYVEREAFCAAVLAARMADGRLPDAPIWSDVATFNGKPWRGVVDIISAGYPCQPFSCAGRRQGEADPRHIWPDIARIIDEVQPSYAFLENVPGHVSLGLRDVCADLRTLGYDVVAGIFSAYECGAPHLRKRLFVLAHADRHPVRKQSGRCGWQGRQGKAKLRKHGKTRSVADTERQHAAECPLQLSLGGEMRGVPPRRTANNHRACSCGAGVANAEGAREAGGSAFSDVGGVAHGLPSGVDGYGWANGWERGIARTAKPMENRTDRLRALGNAVVPATAAKAFASLLQGVPA